jgi:hypothetical protein
LRSFGIALLAVAIYSPHAGTLQQPWEVGPNPI